jgi:F-type H+-transporting ATPase subunit O
LDSKTLQKLQQVLQKSALVEGKELTLVNHVDPQIVGGLVIELGEKTIDLSVSSKITKLNNLLSTAV